MTLNMTHARLEGCDIREKATKEEAESLLESWATFTLILGFQTAINQPFSHTYNSK